VVQRLHRARLSIVDSLVYAHGGRTVATAGDTLPFQVKTSSHRGVAGSPRVRVPHAEERENLRSTRLPSPTARTRKLNSEVVGGFRIVRLTAYRRSAPART